MNLQPDLPTPACGLHVEALSPVNSENVEQWLMSLEIISSQGGTGVIFFNVAPR